jgi:hypothetical protein
METDFERLREGTGVDSWVSCVSSDIRLDWPGLGRTVRVALVVGGGAAAAGGIGGDEFWV